MIRKKALRVNPEWVRKWKCPGMDNIPTTKNRVAEGVVSIWGISDSASVPNLFQSPYLICNCGNALVCTFTLPILSPLLWCVFGACLQCWASALWLTDHAQPVGGTIAAGSAPWRQQADMWFSSTPIHTPTATGPVDRTAPRWVGSGLRLSNRAGRWLLSFTSFRATVMLLSCWHWHQHALVSTSFLF